MTDDPKKLCDAALLAAFYALPLSADGTHDAYGEAVVAEVERRNLDF